MMDPAFFYKIVKRFKRLFDRRIVIPHMQDIQIDIIGIEPLQRSIQVLFDMFGHGHALFDFFDRAREKFCRDHDLLSVDLLLFYEPPYKGF